MADDGDAHRSDSAAGVSDAPRRDRLLRELRQGADRDQHDDRTPCGPRFHVRRARPSRAAAERDRRRGDLGHLRALVPELPPLDSGADRPGRHGFHQVDQLPLSLHRGGDRGQHPQHGPRAAGAGISAVVRAHGSRIRRGPARRHGGRRVARARRAPHTADDRGSRHGRRGGRGRHTALDRLRAAVASAAGRAVRAGAAAGDVRESDGDSAFRDPELPRPPVP